MNVFFPVGIVVHMVKPTARSQQGRARGRCFDAWPFAMRVSGHKVKTLKN